MTHSRPGSPKKPCRLTYTGAHQWFVRRRKRLCWICGAVKEKIAHDHTKERQ